MRLPLGQYLFFRNFEISWFHDKKLKYFFKNVYNLSNNKINMFKQLCINRLSTNGPLYDDVIHIIKSFAFYDIQTAKTRKIKQKIVHRFLSAEMSRFRPNGCYQDENGVDEDSDTCEHWSICLAIVSKYDDIFYTIIIPEKQIQGVNCSICGGYHQEFLAFPVPQKIICNCHAALLIDN